jgi:hypothetical protein
MRNIIPKVLLWNKYIIKTWWQILVTVIKKVNLKFTELLRTLVLSYKKLYFVNIYWTIPRNRLHWPICTGLTVYSVLFMSFNTIFCLRRTFKSSNFPFYTCCFGINHCIALLPSLVFVVWLSFVLSLWVLLKQVLGAWGMLHFFIIPQVLTQSNRVCNFHVILLWFKFPKDHTFPRFL